jgi:hypothetical protein
MKFQLTEKDHLEQHHMYSLIRAYAEDNDGKMPEYIIVHPATYHKIIMLTNERNDSYNFNVVQFSYKDEKPFTKLYGIDFIRSQDVEEGFVIIT